MPKKRGVPKIQAPPVDGSDARAFVHGAMQASLRCLQVALETSDLETAHFYSDLGRAFMEWAERAASIHERLGDPA